MLLETLLALFTLTFISIGALLISQKIRLPYTVLLLFFGTLLVPLSSLSYFSFLREFELTPEILFFVFLPILIFESAYTINIRELTGNIRTISFLAIGSFLLSTLFISCILYFGLPLIGLPIPFLVTLLFASLISATDPVAVLSLFKDFGAPRRLSLIFEGESLFNDGTAMAVFLIVLEILLHGFNGWGSLGEGLFFFTSMIIGGVLFGLFMGLVFSKLLEKMQRNEFAEITITMLAAHLTFILSEVISSSVSFFGYSLHISAIIATVITSVVIGNYGRSKMSKGVEEYMEKFWGYFAFIANSLVFISMGLLFHSLHINLFQFILPIILTIFIVMIGRAFSIYPVISLLNILRWEKPIPSSWQHLLSWGSLRGALAITMVLFIPENATLPGWEYSFSIKEFIAAITIGCIYFTLFIKATTIRRVMNRYQLGELHPLEEAQYRQAKSLIYAHAIAKFSDYHNKGYITDKVFASLKDRYDREYTKSCAISHELYETKEGRDIAQRALRVYAIGIERHFLKILFHYGEITEPVYKRVLGKLALRLTHVENGDAYAGKDTLTNTDDWLEIFVNFLRKLIWRKENLGKDLVGSYMYYRAQEIIARKVLKYLKTFVMKNGYGLFGDKAIFDALLKEYERFALGAKKKMQECEELDEESLAQICEDFGRRGVLKAEEDELKELTENEMITPKLSILLANELRKEVGKQ